MITSKSIYDYYHYSNQQPQDIIQYIKNDILPYVVNNPGIETICKTAFWIDNEELLGVIFCTSIRDQICNTFHLKRFFVSENARGKGIGGILLDHMWSYFYEHKDCKFIRMYCDPDACAWYEKKGFRFWGYNEEGYGYVYQPMILQDIEKNNKIISQIPLTDLVDDYKLELIKKLNLYDKSN